MDYVSLYIFSVQQRFYGHVSVIYEINKEKKNKPTEALKNNVIVWNLPKWEGTLDNIYIIQSYITI